MNQIVMVFRYGPWLSPARIRRVATCVAVGTVLCLFFLAATAHGLSDYSGRPLGTDFSSFYAAGRLVQLGSNPYEPGALHAMQQRIFGAGTPYYGFAYPPFFLLLARPLAMLPYLLSLAVWQAGTFAIYLSAMTLLKRRFGQTLPDGLFYLCAAAFTAVFVTLTHGQNGFLTAALFAAGLASLGIRPWLAGLCFGFVAYKPQFGVLIPFALAAGAHWRSFAAAVVTVLALIGICTLWLGAPIWAEFLKAAGLSQSMILDSGAVGYAKMVSVFAWLRLWHFPLAVAYIGQAIAALLIIVESARLWRSDADPRLQGAALCVGALLATPFALDYDLMLLAPAIALLAGYEIQCRSIPFGASLLAVLWLTPLFARSIATLTLIPLTSWILIACFVAIMKQAASRDFGWGVAKG